MPLPPPLDLHPASAQEELRRSRERLLFALEAGRMGTWDWNVKTDRVAWSPTLERLHGIEPGGFAGTFEAALEQTTPNDRERVLARIEESLAKRTPYHVEYRIVRPDGALRWLESRGKLFLDDDGEPSLMAGVCSDVTERKRGEDTLRLLAEESRTLGTSLDCEATLENVASLLVPELADWCAVDLVSAEGGLERLITLHSDPDVQMRAEAILECHPPAPDAALGPPAVIRSGEPVLAERITDEHLEAAARDDEHFEALRKLGLRSVIITPLKARRGIIGALTLATAESRRRFDRDDLQVASEIAHRAAQAVDNARTHEDLERALEARDRVLAVVSHDLREPLNSIALALGLVEESNSSSDPRVERALASAGRGLEQAERLIQDLLDASRLDSGKLSLDRHPIDAAGLLREALEPFRTECRRAGVEIEVAVGGDLPLLRGDRHRLHQVLANLLRNALEVTPRGGRIEVAADHDAEDGCVCFRITDSGPGIPSEDLEHLFDAFWQGDGPGRGSAGLGLSIARGLVEAHGGRIHATSDPDAGATLSFTLPTES